MNARRGTSVANVGQRRPPQQPQNLANNFVQGGQLKPQPQPLIKMEGTPQQDRGPQKLQQPALNQQFKPASQKPTSDVTQPGPLNPVRSPQPQQQQQPNIKQEPVTPVKPPSQLQQPNIPPLAVITQQQVRLPQSNQTPAQKLTPVQQQAIKQQQVLKQQQVQQATQVAKATAAAAVVAIPPQQPIVPQVVPQPTTVQKEPTQPDQQSVVMDENVQDTKDAANMEVVDMDVKTEGVINVDSEGVVKKKPNWVTNKERRLSSNLHFSKADKIKRRNARFRKMLQPKNALMILNEMNGSTAGGTQYTFVELGGQDNVLKSTKHPGGFKAITVVDGTEFSGVGVDKATAKSNAAEAAIKSIILKKILSVSVNAKQHANLNTNNDAAASTIDDCDVVMNDSGGDSVVSATAGVSGTEGEIVPWMHIASFALHKLFNSWEETGTLLRATSQGNLSEINDPIPAKMLAADIQQLTGNSNGPSQQPQRALPENAASIHPIMLLNQMRPSITHYTELSSIGNPPQILYSFECTVDGQGGFVGKGPNKKIARRNAAYAACQTVLNLAYPEDVLAEIAESSEPRKLPPTLAKTVRMGGTKPQGGGGFFVRQTQIPQQQQQEQQQQQPGGNLIANNDVGVGDGFNTGADQGYQWY